MNTAIFAVILLFLPAVLTIMWKPRINLLGATFLVVWCLGVGYLITEVLK